MDKLKGYCWNCNSEEPLECQSCGRDDKLTSLNVDKYRLSNLLARIHRDGGHYERLHGTKKAFEDADLIVANLYGKENE